MLVLAVGTSGMPQVAHAKEVGIFTPYMNKDGSWNLAVGKKLKERGLSLRAEIDKEYKKLSVSHALESGHAVDITPIIKKYIPLGLSFNNIGQVLGAAGFQMRTYPYRKLGNFRYNTIAVIDPQDKNFHTKSVNIFFSFPRADKGYLPVDVLAGLKAIAEKPISLEERGRQLRAELDREYGELSKGGLLPSGGVVDITDLVQLYKYIPEDMPLIEVEKILHGAGLEIDFHPDFPPALVWYRNKADAEAKIGPHDKDFLTEKIGILLGYSQKAYKDPTNAVIFISAIAEKVIPYKPNKGLIERGQKLRKRLERVYHKWRTLPRPPHGKSAHSLSSDRKAYWQPSVNLTPIVMQYIPLGTSLDDGEQILRDAGFNIHPHQDDYSNGILVVVGHLDPYGGFWSELTKGFGPDLFCGADITVGLGPKNGAACKRISETDPSKISSDCKMAGDVQAELRNHCSYP